VGITLCPRCSWLPNSSSRPFGHDLAAIPDEIVFVLDDYHVIASAPADDAIAFLLEACR
jgi:ATP/maltotriose-dependent transcriptional regulator MalT